MHAVAVLHVTENEKTRLCMTQQDKERSASNAPVRHKASLTLNVKKASLCHSAYEWMPVRVRYATKNKMIEPQRLKKRSDSSKSIAHLEIIWKFRSTSITRIHRDEGSTCCSQLQLRAYIVSLNGAIYYLAAPEHIARY